MQHGKQRLRPCRCQDICNKLLDPDTGLVPQRAVSAGYVRHRVMTPCLSVELDDGCMLHFTAVVLLVGFLYPITRSDEAQNCFHASSASSGMSMSVARRLLNADINYCYTRRH